MSGYITTFSVYTLAMIGVIFIALVIARKSLSFGNKKNKDEFLKVENSLSLEPRKVLYVVKAGEEKFLIASTPEGCQFMSKLDESTPQENDLPLIEGNIESIPTQQRAFPEIKMPLLNIQKNYSKKYKAGIF